MCDDSHDPVEEYYYNRSNAGIEGRENSNKHIYSRSLQPERLPALEPLFCNKEWTNSGKRISEEEQRDEKRKRRE